MMIRTKTRGRRASAFANVVAVLALLVALAALGVAVCRDPYGPVTQFRNPSDPDLAGYDFSSASGALKSALQMQYKGDQRAMIELNKQLSAPLKEVIDTLEIKKEVDVKYPDKDPQRGAEQTGKTPELKLLFITFKKKGESQYKVNVCEKQESGLWQHLPNAVAFYIVEPIDKALAKECRDWETQGLKK